MNEARERRRGRLEWAGAAVAGVLVAAMIATLLFGRGAGDAELPDLVARTEGPAAGGDGRQVRFVVENRGGAAAAGVVVALTLGGDPTRVAGRLTINHIPANGVAGGGFVLDPSLAAGGVVVRVEGYVDP